MSALRWVQEWSAIPNFPKKFRLPDGNLPPLRELEVSPWDALTVDPSHDGEDGMGVRSVTVGRYEEIRSRACTINSPHDHVPMVSKPAIGCDADPV